MFPFFQKRSALSKREKRLERQLAEVRRNIDDLEKNIKNPESLRKRRKAELRDSPRGNQPVRRSTRESSGLEERPAERADGGEREGTRRQALIRNKSNEVPAYLAAALHANRPLRFEREKQRNKAIIMSIVAVLVVLWFVFKLFL